MKTIDLPPIPLSDVRCGDWYVRSDGSKVLIDPMLLQKWDAAGIRLIRREEIRFGESEGKTE